VIFDELWRLRWEIKRVEKGLLNLEPGKDQLSEIHEFLKRLDRAEAKNQLD